jgi:hypothetical protein
VSVMLDKEASQRPAAESLSENLDAIRAGKKVELRRAGAAPKPKGTEATTTVERASLNPPGRAAYQADAGKLVAGRQGVSAASSGAGNTKRNWTAVGTVIAVAALGVLFVGLIAGGNEADTSSLIAEGNEPDTSSDCIRESKDDFLEETAAYRELYDDYESSRAKANLSDWVGDLRDIPWAPRAANLIADMESDLQSAEERTSQLSPASQAFVARITIFHANLSAAWSHLSSVSTSASDVEWDDARYKVSSWEASLRNVVSGEHRIQVETCAELVQ